MDSGKTGEIVCEMDSAKTGEIFCGMCNVQLADEIMLIGIISLIMTFAHAPVLSNLIYTKHAQ